jgi:hypothetical protein
MLTAPSRRASLLVIWLLLVVASCGRTGRPGLDLNALGGTVLVYEVRRGASDRTVAELATLIRRRIDPADIVPITVRVVGEYGIEIAIIREGDRKAELERVEEVKKLVAADPLGLTLAWENTVEPK